MKRLILPMSILFVFANADAQSAMDGFKISQPDLKGTARFMSMGGAFGALGGDLSTLSQNPAGVGVYRSNEIGLTLNLDAQSSSSGGSHQDQTKFLLNNLGGIFTMKLPSKIMPNFNIGFSYNKASSFNRRYKGGIGNLQNSMSNYIAGLSNTNELTVNDVATSPNFDPYNPTDGGYQAPWLTILGYDSYLVNPEGEGTDTRWYGQWGNGTRGSGVFQVEEKGSLDEFNIALGGNLANTVYWGMNFDIVSVNYTQQSLWGENLTDAYVPTKSDEIVRGSSDWRMNNYYHLKGTGFNYQIGVIFKPIQELRLGLAFHTPTWYNLTEQFAANVNYDYSTGVNGKAETNNGYIGYNDFDFRSPMKFIGSVAGVIGGRFILSADYEWIPYDKMHYKVPGNYGGWNDILDDPWSIPYAQTRNFDEYEYENGDVKAYYQASNTIRLGAEFRVTPEFSVRAGYSFVSSPIKNIVKENKETIYTGLNPSYRIDDTTNYYTCGIGYKKNRFSVDLAYVYKTMNATYHAYTPDVTSTIQSPQADVNLKNSQVVLSAAIRF